MRILLPLILALGTTMSVAAQEKPSSLPSVDELKILVAEQQRDLSESPESASSAASAEALQTIGQVLSAAETLDAQADRFQELLANSDSLLVDLQQEWSTLNQRLKTTSAESQARRYIDDPSELLDKVAALTEQSTQVNNEIVDLQARQGLIEPEFVEARKELESLRTQLQAVGATEAVLSNNKYLALISNIRLQTVNIRKLELELKSHDARLSIARATRDVITIELHHLQEVSSVLAEISNKKKFDDVKRVISAIGTGLDDIDTTNPTVSTEAEINRALANNLDILYEHIEKTTALKLKNEAYYQRIGELNQSLNEQLAVLDNDNFLGEILLSLRSEASEIAKDSYASSTHHEHLKIARHEQAKTVKRMGNLDLEFEKSKTEISSASDQRALSFIIKNQREQLYQEIDKGLKVLINELTDLTFTQTKLNTGTSELLSRINEQLLWVATNQPIWIPWFNSFYSATSRLPEIASSGDLTSSLENNKQRSLIASMIALILLAWALVSTSKINNRLISHSTKINRVGSDSISYTIEALLLTFILTMRLPIILILAAFVLKASNYETSFEVALSSGLMVASTTWILLDFTRRLFSDNGICQVHFKIDHDLCTNVANSLKSTRIIITLLFGLSAFISRFSDQQLDDTFGRLIFIITSVFVAWLLKRERSIIVYHPSMRDNHGWSMVLFNYGFRFLYLGLIVLALASIIGYHYTAVTISTNLFFTLVAFLTSLLFYVIVRRWILVARKQLLWSQLKAKRAAQAEQEASGATADEGTDHTVDSAESQIADVNTIQSQTMALVRLSCTVFILLLIFIIWDDAGPALNAIDNIKFWQETTIINGEAVDESLSLLDIGIAIMVLVLAVAASRNIPGLIEVVALRYTSVDAGTRYAAVTITRYVILMIGMISSFDAMGISWSKIQWLVAAIGVGLGFGLQEIVANFVGGIVVLFERPMRVGDTVTIGGFNGNVTAIRMRTTTVVDWDNKEIIVPNKLFISESLINWTLSSDVTRLHFTVGVAYGSDTEATLREISAAVESHPEVLSEPAFNVFFLEFGDSSLAFEIRAFVSGAARRLPVMHDLHMEIDRRLREANIEIAFPQLDIHLRSDDTRES